MSFMSLSTTWVKESSSEEEYTKFKQVATTNKIVKEKLQKPIREKKTSEVETTTKFSDDDWYVSNIFSRAQILTFLFVGEKRIRNELHQPHKQGFIAYSMRSFAKTKISLEDASYLMSNGKISKIR